MKTTKVNEEQAMPLLMTKPMTANPHYKSPTTAGVLMPTRIVDPFEPFEPDLTEIVHTLSNINRYNGATSRPYSVAEHSMNCAMAAIVYHKIHTENDLLIILLHDCAEAYLQDLLRPIKQFMGDAYFKAEHRITKAVYAKLHIHANPDLNDILDEIDTRMAVTEITQLLPHHSNPLPGFKPYNMNLVKAIPFSYNTAIQKLMQAKIRKLLKGDSI